MGLKNYIQQRTIIWGMDKDIDVLANVANTIDHLSDVLSNSDEWMSGQDKYNIIFSLAEMGGEATQIANMLHTFRFSASSILEKLNLLERITYTTRVASTNYSGNRFKKTQKNLALYKGGIILFKNENNLKDAIESIQKCIKELDASEKRLANNNKQLDSIIKANMDADTLVNINNRVRSLSERLQLWSTVVNNVCNIYVSTENGIKKVASSLTPGGQEKNAGNVAFENKFKERKSQSPIDWVVFEEYRTIPKPLIPNMNNGKANPWDQHSYNTYNSDGSNYGCYVTSVAMGLNIVLGKDYAPESFLDANGDCNWPNISNVTDSEPINYSKMLQNFQNGCPVFISYAEHVYGGRHAILAVGIDENANTSNLKAHDIIVIDPAKGEIMRLDETWNYSGDDVSMRLFYK